MLSTLLKAVSEKPLQTQRTSVVTLRTLETRRHNKNVEEGVKTTV